ncbi:MAG: hypothetical protein FD150_696 [Rhodobacteraceae bacterium]|nr:MAG: hypothetical protein FD150_696 [Paracoccaceae bacterium]
MWGPVVMGRDYTGEIGEGKGIFQGGWWGPQGTPAWVPTRGQTPKLLILLGDFCGR